MMAFVGVLGLGFQVVTSMATVAAAASAEPSGAGSLVVVEDFAFTPSTVTIHTGGTVVWSVRKDPEQHTVTPAEPGAFEGSGQLFAGDDYTVRFDSAWRYEYLCTLHPFMTGKVVVETAVTPTASPPPSSPSSPSPASVGASAPGSTGSLAPADEPIDPAAGSGPALAIAMLLLALGVGLVASLALRRRPR